ncbi:MAG: dCTP deaminase [Candidatus Bathyarchaeia archaeon]
MKRYCKLLTKKDIEERIKNESIFIVPILDEKNQIGSSSVDVRLDCYFLETKHTGKGIVEVHERMDPYDSTKLVTVDLFRGKYTLQPGEFVNCQTFEYISLSRDLFGLIDGRSSLGRLGVVVHSTASSIDPGWEGHLTLELHNDGKMPVKLLPLMRIARLLFFEIPEVEVGYSGLEPTERKYYRQTKPTPSKIYEDKDLQLINKIREKIEKDEKTLSKKLLGEQ